MNDAIKAQVSAFVDGELPQSELELLLRRMSQDAELRQLAAEYLAMRRVMRGERRVAGLGELRHRIAAAIGDQDTHPGEMTSEQQKTTYVKPLAGFAIAASVALAAIIGIQQMDSEVDVPQTPGTVAEADASYTVPDQVEDQLREYYFRHAASSSHIGADRINARLVTLELRDGVLLEIEQPEVEEPAEAQEQATPAE